MLQDCQARVPVNTGKLKDSLEVKVSISKTTAKVKVQTRAENKEDQFYGSFVEFGTHQQAPQPFMRPALDAAHKDRYREQLSGAIAQEIEKLKA